MKYFLAFFIAVVCATAGGLGTAFYLDYNFKDNFYAMTGVTYQEFEESYANCVFKGGELCNLYGGFAPKSKFRANKPDSI